MKKRAFLSLLLAASLPLFAAKPSTVKFIKGSVSDKTEALREAEGAEAYMLSRAAIRFALDSRKALGDDNDMVALTVAGILALPNAYVSAAGPDEKKSIADDFSSVFESFDNNAARSAVINKAMMLSDFLPIESFVALLNGFLETSVPQKGDSAIQDAARALGAFGDGESCRAVYGCFATRKWPQYQDDMADALARMSERTLPQILSIIQGGTAGEVRALFDIIEKNDGIQQSFKAEIAENSLLRAIQIAQTSQAASRVGRETVALQMDAARVISRLKWTRAAQTVRSFLDLAEREYKAMAMSPSEFAEVVSCAAAVSPISASAPLSSCLAEMIGMAESGGDFSEEVMLSVIDALGSIGDKSSFDTLLSVSNSMTVSAAVKAAANKALARLKW